MQGRNLAKSRDNEIWDLARMLYTKCNIQFFFRLDISNIDWVIDVSIQGENKMAENSL